MNFTLANPLWGWLSLTVAIIYLFVWPSTLVPTESGLRAALVIFVLRWMHSITWILLALSFFVRSGSIRARAFSANGIAFVGLLCYLIFIGTVICQHFIRH